MLKFSEIFDFSRKNPYFERIRMVRMVRMVRSLADRTFQLCAEPPGRGGVAEPRRPHNHRLHGGLRERDLKRVQFISTTDMITL